MPLSLGSAFAPRQDVEVVEAEPHAPTIEDLRSEQLLVALAALQDALQNMPAPQVHISEPDLTGIVNAVNGLKGPASADDIARAVVAEISPGGELGMDQVLRDVADALKQLDFRMKGIGGQNSAVLPSSFNVSDRPDRLLGSVSVSNLPATQAVSGTVAVSNFPATQPVSAASLPLPTGAATAAAQTANTTALTDGSQRVGGTVAVSGPLTDAQLRATPVPVSGTVTATPTGTQAVSAVSLPLPTGASQDATLTSGSQRVQARTTPAYAVTPAGGGKFFAASTGRSSSASTTAAVIAALVNPSGSGIDIYVERIKLSASTTGNFEHWRQGTLSSLGVAQTSVDRSGGGVTSTGKVYISANVSATGGTSEDVYFTATNQPFVDNINGEERLQPGQNIYFTFTAAGVNTGSLNISFQWREVTAGSN